MTNREDDLDVLETLLDGELDEDAAERVRRRLSDEPALAAELARLEGARATRARALSAYEAPAAVAQALTERVIRQTRRQERIDRLVRFARPVTGAAACLVVGLILGRGIPATGGQTGFAGSPPLGETTATASARPPGTPLTFTPRPAEVALTDASGRVVAVQRFATQEQAVRFVSELNAAQARRQLAARPAAPVSPVVPVSTQDRF